MEQQPQRRRSEASRTIFFPLIEVYRISRLCTFLLGAACLKKNRFASDGLVWIDDDLVWQGVCAEGSAEPRSQGGFPRCSCQVGRLFLPGRSTVPARFIKAF